MTIVGALIDTYSQVLSKKMAENGRLSTSKAIPHETDLLVPIMARMDQLVAIVQALQVDRLCTEATLPLPTLLNYLIPPTYNANVIHTPCVYL